MGFEPVVSRRCFKNTRTRPLGVRVSLYRGGRIHFNVAALLQFPELLSTDWALLYIDRETHQIAVQCTDDMTRADRVKIQTVGNHNRTIDARRVFMALGYFPREKCCVPLTRDTQTGFLVITVPEEMRGQQ